MADEPEQAMTKVSWFVDGFNLYHSIKDMQRPELKWLCLRTLASHFTQPNEQVEVDWFSAIAHHRSPHAVARHKRYMAALKETGVRIHLGRFKKKRLRCKSCSSQYSSHEEKESDVNLAVQMVIQAMMAQNGDKLVLVSGDSDFASTIAMIRGVRPELRVQVLNPPKRRFTHALREALGPGAFIKKIKPIHLERSQLPAVITRADGSEVKRPTKWSLRAPPP